MADGYGRCHDGRLHSNPPGTPRLVQDGVVLHSLAQTLNVGSAVLIIQFGLQKKTGAKGY